MYSVVGEAATALRVTLGYSEVQLQVADVFFDISRHRIALHRQTHNSPIIHNSLHIWVRCQTIRANRGRVSRMGWALGDSRLVTSHAAFL